MLWAIHLARSCQYQCVYILLKYSIQVLLDLQLFLHFGLGVASVSENWHLASPFARTCPYQSVCEKNIKAFLKFQELLGIFAKCHICLRHCLGKGKVAFGNCLVWILSIIICIQNFIKLSHTVEDLRRFPYFQFLLRRCLVQQVRRTHAPIYW